MLMVKTNNICYFAGAWHFKIADILDFNGRSFIYTRYASMYGHYSSTLMKYIIKVHYVTYD